VQLTHGLVGVDAVRPTAVGDDLCVLRKVPQASPQLGHRDRPGAGDVRRAELRFRPNIEHDQVAATQAGSKLIADDHLEFAAVAEIGVRELFDPGDVLPSDIAAAESAPTWSLARR